MLTFLESLSVDQAAAAKILNGRMPGYAIYGWDVFYPEVN